MRIPTLLQKIAELSDHPERRGAIDVDLMLDYTRVLYADLLEWRSKLPATLPSPAKPLSEPAAIEALASAPVLSPSTPEPAPAKTASSAVSAPTTQPGSAKDIRSHIGINDKYQIMSVLFGNDKIAYEEALDHINSAANAESAISWLKERLWIAEEHSDGALQFFDIIRRFFAQR